MNRPLFKTTLLILSYDNEKEAGLRKYQKTLVFQIFTTDEEEK